MPLPWAYDRDRLNYHREVMHIDLRHAMNGGRGWPNNKVTCTLPRNHHSQREASPRVKSSMTSSLFSWTSVPRLSASRSFNPILDGGWVTAMNEGV